VQASTDILVPFVTNRDRYPDAPKYLPKYILMNETKILELKESQTILKYDNTSKPLTILLLCEPWRSFEDIDIFLTDLKMIKKAFSRRKEALPYSSFKILQ
jgi:hypothetical protein